MRFTDILLCAIQAAGVLSAPHAGNEGEAPDFANSSVPPSDTPWLAFTDRVSPLDRRACWSGSPYGCDLGKKRCWKVCGDQGQWCWTAAGDGGGAWNTCSNWGDCNQSAACGKNCNNAAECGCSC